MDVYDAAHIILWILRLVGLTTVGWVPKMVPMTTGTAQQKAQPGENSDARQTNLLSLEEQTRWRAHEIWLRRNGQAGSEEADWLEAEAEVLGRIRPLKRTTHRTTCSRCGAGTDLYVNGAPVCIVCEKESEQVVTLHPPVRQRPPGREQEIKPPRAAKSRDYVPESSKIAS